MCSKLCACCSGPCPKTAASTCALPLAIFSLSAKGLGLAPTLPFEQPDAEVYSSIFSIFSTFFPSKTFVSPCALRALLIFDPAQAGPRPDGAGGGPALAEPKAHGGGLSSDGRSATRRERRECKPGEPGGRFGDTRRVKEVGAEQEREREREGVLERRFIGEVLVK